MDAKRDASFSTVVRLLNGYRDHIQRVFAPTTRRKNIMFSGQNSHGTGIRISGWMLAATLGLLAVPQVVLAQASADGMAAQSSSERGVTVKVTPTLGGSSGSWWEFAIVLDTHSAELSDDLVQSASLTTNDGRTLKPVSWTGAAAGGHHREGVLAFEVPAPRPGAIELRIARPGESAPRIFRWQL